jgi:hypothetical protein
MVRKMAKLYPTDYAKSKQLSTEAQQTTSPVQYPYTPVLYTAYIHYSKTF